MLPPMLAAGARAVEAMLMTSDVTIERPGATSREPGKGYENAPSSFKTYKGNICPTSGEEKVVFDQKAGGTTYRLFLPHDADVQANDKAQVDGKLGVTVYELLEPTSPDQLQKIAIVWHKR